MGNGRTLDLGVWISGELFRNRCGVLASSRVGTPKMGGLGRCKTGSRLGASSDPGLDPLMGSQALFGVWGDPGLDPFWDPTWGQMDLRLGLARCGVFNKC